MILWIHDKTDCVMWLFISFIIKINFKFEDFVEQCLRVILLFVSYVIIAFKFNLHLHCIHLGRHLFKVHILLSSCISWELVIRFYQINYSSKNWHCFDINLYIFNSAGKSLPLYQYNLLLYMPIFVRRMK